MSKLAAEMYIYAFYLVINVIIINISLMKFILVTDKQSQNFPVVLITTRIMY